jgi:hypothetical protein
MIDYRRDDEKRRIVLVARGDVTVDDILAATGRQAAEGAWTYRVLYDARRRRGSLTVPELAQVADAIAEYSAQFGSRGRMAIVVPEVGGYGMAQMYTLVGSRLDGENEVFRNVAEAERWLDEP